MERFLQTLGPITVKQSDQLSYCLEPHSGLISNMTVVKSNGADKTATNRGFYFISFCDVDPLTRMAVQQHRPQSTTNSRWAWPELGLSCAAHHWGRRCASEGPGFGRRIGGIGVNSIIIREYANWAWFMALWIPTLGNRLFVILGL